MPGKILPSPSPPPPCPPPPPHAHLDEVVAGHGVPSSQHGGSIFLIHTNSPHASSSPILNCCNQYSQYSWQLNLQKATNVCNWHWITISFIGEMIACTSPAVFWFTFTIENLRSFFGAYYSIIGCVLSFESKLHFPVCYKTVLHFVKY